MVLWGPVSGALGYRVGRASCLPTAGGPESGCRDTFWGETRIPGEATEGESLADEKELLCEVEEQVWVARGRRYSWKGDEDPVVKKHIKEPGVRLRGNRNRQRTFCALLGWEWSELHCSWISHCWIRQSERLRKLNFPGGLFVSDSHTLEFARIWLTNKLIYWPRMWPASWLSSFIRMQGEIVKILFS